jgi:hypothetical protein
MYNLCRVLNTGILALLTIKSGLGDSYIKMMVLVILLLLSFTYHSCLVLIMLTFDHVVMRFIMLT